MFVEMSAVPLAGLSSFGFQCPAQQENINDLKKKIVQHYSPYEMSSLRFTHSTQRKTSNHIRCSENKLPGGKILSLLLKIGSQCKKCEMYVVSSWLSMAKILMLQLSPTL